MRRIAELTAHRAAHPESVRQAWDARGRRPLLGADGRLLLIAADHPARGALGVRHASMAMADRGELLDRILRALDRPGVDGVLGTADVLEDLLLLGALEDKVVIGSMNRGGVQGAMFEMDDRFTGYRAGRIQAYGLDGGKMLTRICLQDHGSVRTLAATARAVDRLVARGKMAMIEPFWTTWQDGRPVNQLDAESAVRAVSIASGLGSSSAYTWLKLPVVEQMDQVMAATTLPSLLLGGDPVGDPERTWLSWERALALPAVRGLIVGRSLLYPRDEDVAGSVDMAARLVHGAPQTAASADARAALVDAAPAGGSGG